MDSSDEEDELLAYLNKSQADPELIQLEKCLQVFDTGAVSSRKENITYTDITSGGREEINDSAINAENENVCETKSDSVTEKGEVLVGDQLIKEINTNRNCDTENSSSSAIKKSPLAQSSASGNLIELQSDFDHIVTADYNGNESVQFCTDADHRSDNLSCPQKTIEAHVLQTERETDLQSCVVPGEKLQSNPNCSPSQFDGVDEFQMRNESCMTDEKGRDSRSTIEKKPENTYYLVNEKDLLGLIKTLREKCGDTDTALKASLLMSEAKKIATPFPVVAQNGRKRNTENINSAEMLKLNAENTQQHKHITETLTQYQQTEDDGPQCSQSICNSTEDSRESGKWQEYEQSEENAKCEVQRNRTCQDNGNTFLNRASESMVLGTCSQVDAKKGSLANVVLNNSENTTVVSSQGNANTAEGMCTQQLGSSRVVKEYCKGNKLKGQIRKRNTKPKFEFRVSSVNGNKVLLPVSNVSTQGVLELHRDEPNSVSDSRTQAQLLTADRKLHDSRVLCEDGDRVDERSHSSLSRDTNSVTYSTSGESNQVIPKCVGGIPGRFVRRNNKLVFERYKNETSIVGQSKLDSGSSNSTEKFEGSPLVAYPVKDNSKLKPYDNTGIKEVESREYGQSRSGVDSDSIVLTVNKFGHLVQADETEMQETEKKISAGESKRGCSRSVDGRISTQYEQEIDFLIKSALQSCKAKATVLNTSKAGNKKGDDENIVDSQLVDTNKMSAAKTTEKSGFKVGRSDKHSHRKCGVDRVSHQTQTSSELSNTVNAPQIPSKWKRKACSGQVKSESKKRKCRNIEKKESKMKENLNESVNALDQISKNRTYVRKRKLSSKKVPSLCTNCHEIQNVTEYSAEQRNNNVMVSDDSKLPVKKRKLRTGNETVKSEDNSQAYMMISTSYGQSSKRNKSLREAEQEFPVRNDIENVSVKRTNRGRSLVKNVKICEFVALNENAEENCDTEEKESLNSKMQKRTPRKHLDSSSDYVKKADARRKKRPTKRKESVTFENETLNHTSERKVSFKKGRRRKDEKSPKKKGRKKGPHSPDNSWKDLLSGDEFKLELDDLQKSPVKHINVRKVIKHILQPKKSSKMARGRDREAFPRDDGGAKQSRSMIVIEEMEGTSRSSQTEINCNHDVMENRKKENEFSEEDQQFTISSSKQVEHADCSSLQLTETILLNLKERNTDSLLALKQRQSTHKEIVHEDHMKNDLHARHSLSSFVEETETNDENLEDEKMTEHEKLLELDKSTKCNTRALDKKPVESYLLTSNILDSSLSQVYSDTGLPLDKHILESSSQTGFGSDDQKAPVDESKTRESENHSLKGNLCKNTVSKPARRLSVRNLKSVGKLAQKSNVKKSDDERTGKKTVGKKIDQKSSKNSGRKLAAKQTDITVNGKPSAGKKEDVRSVAKTVRLKCVGDIVDQKTAGMQVAGKLLRNKSNKRISGSAEGEFTGMKKKKIPQGKAPSTKLDSSPLTETVSKLRALLDKAVGVQNVHFEMS